MAVIYMPQDQRLAALSQGITGLVNNVGQYQQNSQLAQILQQGMKTGDISAMIPGLLKTGGPQGLQLAEFLTSMASNQAKTKQAQAATDKDVADTELTKQKAKYLPREQELKALETQSTIVANAARARLSDAEAQRAAADAELDPYKKANLMAEARKNQVEADNMQHAQELINSLLHPQGAPGQGGDSTNPGMPNTNDVLGGMSDTDKAALALAGASGKPGEMANTMVSIERKNTPLALPGDAAKMAGNAAATANNLDMVLDAAASGNLKGGPVQAMIALARDKGWLKTPEEQAAPLEAIHQLTYNRATAGGGFGGQWRINISKDTLPNFRKGPAQNILSVAVIAQDQLAELIAEKKRFAGTKTQTAALDEAITKTKQIIDKANTLKVDKKGNVYYQDAIIQGKNGYTPPDIMQSGQKFTFGGKKTFTSEDINGAAIQSGVNVRDILASLIAKYGAQQ